MSHSQEILQILKKVKQEKPVPQREHTECKVETFSFEDLVTEHDHSVPLNHDLNILKSFWNPIGDISMNQPSQTWKIMHPYAKELSYGEPREIEVLIHGKFIDEVPSGLCSVTYQHHS